jgi:malonate-semialdehyde dehydrogenase (acetylating)/methylmalonate-semialdehyde dehydrogenase
MTTTVDTEPAAIGHFIAGRVEDQSPDRCTSVTESASGQVIARAPHATAAVVDRAVESAAEAAAEWGAASISRRTGALFAFREAIHAHRDELAEIVTREHGKVLSDAAGEVQRGLEVLEYACGVGELLKGQMSGQVSRGVDSYSLRQPLGVVAGITPFNFPVMVPMWMIPMAIACGNAFILKPSDQDPSAGLRLAELAKGAGLPDGVLNVVQGDKIAVDALLEHPRVEAVSFVGSTPVAKHVHEAASLADKRVQALGGAKNHAVVLPDADLELAADAVVSAGYGSAGQRCMAVSVAVAVGDVADPLIEKVVERTSGLVVGDGLDPASQMGPLVSENHLNRVRGLIDAGVRDGAELVVDGREIEVPGHPGGHFLGPCLFDRVRPGMSIYDEEIFGPVLLVVRVDSYAEAIDLISANPYGNGAAIFTNDGGAARLFEQQVTAGMVGINVPIPVPMAYHSFGGWKDSLFGDLHVHGPDGVRFYTRGKVVTRRWADPGHRGVDLGFPTSS